jgi:two-component system, chemotaxis family, chemotaxis protein CheY
MAQLDQLKALVVDDNAHMRSLLRSLLHAIGVTRAFEAMDGGEGFKEFCTRRPDFIITDLSMAPVDGIEFTRMVRHNADSPDPCTPVIMLTGHTERPRVVAARDAGVTEFLAKPITGKSLALHISQITERPRAFVRCSDYFGPDRRRHKDAYFKGPWRRADDGDVAAI